MDIGAVYDTIHSSGTIELNELHTVLHNQSTLVGTALNAQPSSLFYLIAALAISYIVIRYIYKIHYGELILSLFSTRIHQKVIRENSSEKRYPILFLQLNYAIQLGLLIPLFYNYKGIWATTDLLITTELTGILIIVFVARALSIYLIGQLFNVQKEIKRYLEVTNLSQAASGIVLPPVIIVILFSSDYISDPLIIAALCWLIWVTVLRIGRGVSQIITSQMMQSFHIIFYLCSLETTAIVLTYNFVEKLLF